MAGYDVAGDRRGRGLAAFLCLLAACCLALGVPLLVAMLQLRDLHISSASPQQTNRSINSSHAAGGLTAPAQPQVTPGAATAEALLQTVEVEVPHDMVPPVYLYYQLPWFYQNHKRYVRSISWSQMAGRGRASGGAAILRAAEVGGYLGGRRDASLPDQAAIHPCGLIPSSLFNDSFSLHQTCDDAALSGHIPLHLDVAFRSELATALFSNPRNATNFNTVASLRGWWDAGRASGPGSAAVGCRLRLEVANRYNSYAWGGQKAVLLSTASWAASTPQPVPPGAVPGHGRGLWGVRTRLVTYNDKPPRREHGAGSLAIRRWSCNSMSADTTAPAQSDKLKVAPSDVVLVGSGVLAAGALAGAVATYRSGSKSLVEDGINPDIRMRMIPIAALAQLCTCLVPTPTPPHPTPPHPTPPHPTPPHPTPPHPTPPHPTPPHPTPPHPTPPHPTPPHPTPPHPTPPHPTPPHPTPPHPTPPHPHPTPPHPTPPHPTPPHPTPPRPAPPHPTPPHPISTVPLQVKTLMLSMAFTSMLGVAGFYGLKAAGLFSADVAELPSVREAAAMLRNPRRTYGWKRSKRPNAKQAAEPTQPIKAKARARLPKPNPAPQPGRWLDRNCNAALNMQRIGESRWRSLEQCWWPEQAALPAKGKEYPGLGYKWMRGQATQGPPTAAAACCGTAVSASPT
ncbi:hypothetical protein QJQ45_028228 [Haematococcus lacustris]|nr:hypothetical protein QJQ45_028228 [Haematococcus lacustris]